MKKPKAGQTILFVGSSDGEPVEREITKVGTTYAYFMEGFSEMRMDWSTGYVLKREKGMTKTIGVCYSSRDHYERSMVSEAWINLKSEMGSRCPEAFFGAWIPDGVTLEDIADARRILRLS